MHPVHQVWCESGKEDKYTEKVRSFLSELRWLEEEHADGGITWIELYALYSIHGGSKDEEERRRREPCNKNADAKRTT